MSKQVLVVIPVEECHKEYLENIGTGCAVRPLSEGCL